MRKQNNSKNIYHLWIPDLDSATGGIQRYSRFFLKAVTEIFPESQFEIFVKNDFPRRVHDSDKKRINYFGQYPFVFKTIVYAITIFTYAILHRPSLIITTHLHFAPVAYFLKLITNKKYMIAVHGIEVRKKTSFFVLKALRNADRVLAVSAYTKNLLVNEQGVCPEKVRVFPNTFDSNRFCIGPKVKILDQLGIAVSAPVLLTVARLSSKERYKGHDNVLKALTVIKQTIPGICYLIVGTGDDEDRIKKLILDLNLQDNARLVGFVSDAELPDYYNACDILVMPSKGEGFGIVYLEALACGKPVIAGNIDGSRDALLDGQLGVLVNPDSVEEIADAVIKILRKDHANAILYQPEQLRKKAIDAFGFEKFKNNLTLHIQEYEKAAI